MTEAETMPKSIDPYQQQISINKLNCWSPNMLTWPQNLKRTRIMGGKVEELLRFIRGTRGWHFVVNLNWTKMTENKNIVVFDSSNALLDSLEINVIDHGIKLIQMVEKIVKDYSVDSILIENNWYF